MRQMRLVAAGALFGWLLMSPGLGMADDANPPDVVDPQEATPPESTRVLDPPMAVDPFAAPDVGAAASEVVTPMPFPPDPPQHLPPGPPNRMP